MNKLKLFTISGLLVACSTISATNNRIMKIESDDLWLEEIQSEAALNWVRGENARSLPQLQQDGQFKSLEQQLLERLNSPDKLSAFYIRKNYVYDFWQDQKNVRGVVRRATWQSYQSGKPKWQIILDIDKLADVEKENWVYGGFSIFENRAMVALSYGGKDAKVYREYDISKKQFIKNGFILPEGKHRVTWLDKNQLLVGPTGVGDDTESGYPRTVRIWKRGESFDRAPILFSGNFKDVSVGHFVNRDDYDLPARHVLFTQAIDFFNIKIYLWKNHQTVELPLPSDAQPTFYKENIYFTLQKDWQAFGKKYLAGSLIKISIDDLLSQKSPPQVLFTPSPKAILAGFRVVQDRVFLGTLNDVNSEWAEIKATAEDTYELSPIALPNNSSINLTTFSESSGQLVFQVENFLSPPTRFLYNLADNKLRQLERAKDRFNSEPYKVEQFFATSRDGTRVPYYQVSSKNLNLNGRQPTLLTAYGGFLVNRTPVYSYAVGLGWLEQGGVFVLANIRGGAEYGPKWHQAALKENRQRAFDDFFAVAEDLVRRQVTSPSYLGAMGGSNGGLLMGVAMTQRPDLFNAIAIQVPLLDMLRYHLLLAGASWVSEYGNPNDEKMRAAILKYSPYQNVKAEAKYPEVFFMTSMADDRVHPGHARRMAYKMKQQGHPFLYYENIEGGHGGSANLKQQAYWWALQYTYFKQKLIGK